MKRPRALDVKLLVLVIAILSGGMGALTYVNILRHEQDLISGIRLQTETVADSLRAGINSIMRTGDICRARDYVRDMRAVEGIANLKIYNTSAGEAFLYPESTSAPAAADENVRSAIASGRPIINETAGGKTIMATVPLLNESACHRCHGADHKIRGAFSMAFHIQEQEESLGPSDLMLRAAKLINDTIVAFYQGLMLSDLGRSEKEYVASLVLVPGIEQVTVYDRKGDQKFSAFPGKSPAALSEAEREQLLRAGIPVTHTLESPDAHRIAYMHPFSSKESCRRCHTEEDRQLGVLALTLNLSSLSEAQEKDKSQDVLAEMMVSLVTRCLQEVMKIGGAAPVRSFAQQSRALPQIADLKIFDRQGREVYPERVVLEKNIRKVFESGSPVEAIEEEDGLEYLTLLQPIFNGEECRRCHGSTDRVRAVIAVSVSLERVRQRIAKGKAFSVIAASGTVLLVCILIVGFIELAIVRPIRRIGEVAERVGAGNLNLRADDGKQDEFGSLARRINTMIEGLTDKQRIEESLRIARDIQRSHLPRRNPEIPGLDVAGWSLPAEETGGDYYDFITQEGKLLLVLADVTSHGIGPALIMSQTRALVRAAMLTVKDISRAVGIVNSLLCADLVQGRFVTLFIGEIDPTAMVLRYLSAGHNPPILLRAGSNTAENLRTTSLPLGINPDARFEVAPLVELRAGDVLLLATDGASEACNRKGERFGRKGLQQALLANGSKSAQEIVEAIGAAVRSFRAGAQQRDDLTMVVARISREEQA